MSTTKYNPDYPTELGFNQAPQINWQSLADDEDEPVEESHDEISED